MQLEEKNNEVSREEEKKDITQAEAELDTESLLELDK